MKRGRWALPYCNQGERTFEIRRGTRPKERPKKRTKAGNLLSRSHSPAMEESIEKAEEQADKWEKLTQSEPVETLKQSPLKCSKRGGEAN